MKNLKFKKEEKIFIGIGLGILLVVVAFLIARRIKAKRELKQGSSETFEATISAAKPDSKLIGNNTNINFPLKLGSGYSDSSIQEKESVKKLQTFLNKSKVSPMGWGASKSDLPDLKIDGMFGAKTAEMLKAVYNVTEVSKDFYTKYVA